MELSIYSTPNYPVGNSVQGSEENSVASTFGQAASQCQDVQVKKQFSLYSVKKEKGFNMYCCSCRSKHGDPCEYRTYNKRQMEHHIICHKTGKTRLEHHLGIRPRKEKDPLRKQSDADPNVHKCVWADCNYVTKKRRRLLKHIKTHTSMLDEWVKQGSSVENRQAAYAELKPYEFRNGKKHTEFHEKINQAASRNHHRLFNCVVLSRLNLTCLPRLNDFWRLNTLDVRSNNLHSLNVLPSRLVSIVCDNNPLQSIEGIPKCIRVISAVNIGLRGELNLVKYTYLKCLYVDKNRDLKEISNPPSVLLKLSLSYTAITELSFLGEDSETDLKELNCSHTAIKKLPRLYHTAKINCSHTPIKELPYLYSLVKLNCSHTAIKELPYLSMVVEFINCSHTAIKTLPLLPEGFKEIKASHCLFVSLPRFNNKKIYIDFRHNLLPEIFVDSTLGRVENGSDVGYIFRDLLRCTYCNLSMNLSRVNVLERPQYVLEHTNSHLQSLQALCRVNIMHTFQLSDSDVDLLPLPNLLKDYLKRKQDRAVVTGYMESE